MVPPDRLPPMCKIRLTDFWEHFNAEYADLERDAVQSLQNGSSEQSLSKCVKFVNTEECFAQLD